MAVKVTSGVLRACRKCYALGKHFPNLLVNNDKTIEFFEKAGVAGVDIRTCGRHTTFGPSNIAQLLSFELIKFPRALNLLGGGWAIAFAK
jgi:hypothetical protein